MAELDERMSPDEYADWATFYRYEFWLAEHQAEVQRARLGGSG